jgi:hypothetical protein
MIRQQKRQQSEVGFTVTVQRDVLGYEVRSRFAQAGAAETTLAGGGYCPGDEIVEIVAKSGRTEPVSFSTNHQRPRIWTKLKRLTGPSEIAQFMTKWAPLDAQRPPVVEYRSNFRSLGGLVDGLKRLVPFVETYDRTGFLTALGHAPVFHGTMVPDASANGLVGHVSSLSQFLILEMWLDFGAERPARESIRTCRWCRRVFRVGGRRESPSRRSDARYCSDSCKNQASRARNLASPSRGT